MSLCLMYCLQIKRLWQSASWGYDTAVQDATAAIALATENHASQTVVCSCAAVLRGMP